MTHHRRTSRRRGRWLNPVAAFQAWVEWFEQRGVYVPGEDSRTLSAWQDFTWWIVGWLLGVAVLVVFFAVAS